MVFTARRNARIASAVLATAIPSVCPSVRHTRRAVLSADVGLLVEICQRTVYTQTCRHVHRNTSDRRKYSLVDIVVKPTAGHTINYFHSRDAKAFKVRLNSFNYEDRSYTKTGNTGQCMPPPGHVLPVSRYESESLSRSVNRIATKI